MLERDVDRGQFRLPRGDLPVQGAKEAKKEGSEDEIEQKIEQETEEKADSGAEDADAAVSSPPGSQIFNPSTGGDLF